MTFEELTPEAQKAWNDMASNLSPRQALFYQLSKLQECPHCSTKFPDGIIKKLPFTVIENDAYMWYTTKFLAHAQTTHGLSPESLTSIIENFDKSYNEQSYPQEAFDTSGV